MTADIQMLMDVTYHLDKILFDDYVKRKSAEIAKIIEKGVLDGSVNWFEAPKPTGERPFFPIFSFFVAGEKTYNGPANDHRGTPVCL